MLRFILPIILIGISITGFFMFTSPFLKDISTLQIQRTSYNEALDNSKALENERDKLTKKYNSIDPDNLAKLQKLLPDNVDNVRLILEMEKVAAPYGMILKDIRYSAEAGISAGSATPVQGGTLAPNQTLTKNYGIWNLEFSVSSTYNNFLNFVKDLESNLRIVDITSIDFSSDSGGLSTSSSSEVYRYNFKIKTYWLKN